MKQEPTLIEVQSDEEYQHYQDEADCEEENDLLEQEPAIPVYEEEYENTEDQADQVMAADPQLAETKSIAEDKAE